MIPWIEYVEVLRMLYLCGISSPSCEKCCMECPALDLCLIKWTKGEYYCHVERRDKWCSVVKEEVIARKRVSYDRIS